MSSPIRILHCIPGEMRQGGIQNFIMNYYRKLNRNVIQFDFIVHETKDHTYEKEIEELGGKIYTIEYKTRNFKKYKNQLEKILKEHPEYKIIHIHAPYALAITDVMIAKKYGLKTIVHAHSSNEILKRKLIHFLCKKQLSKRSDYKFACSKKAALWLFSKKYVDNNQITIIRNAIDTQKYLYNETIRQKEREKLGIEDYFVIGNVSRLTHLKNISFLIDIFKEIHEKNNKTKLLIVGEGPEKNNLQEKTKRLNLTDSVIFYGNCNNANEILQVIDAFVMPSKCEGFGISLLEAQTASIKCFTSKYVVPNEVQIQNNKNLLEFISLKENPRVWAEKILAWNNSYERENMYGKIKESGFDLERNIYDLQKKYIEIWGDTL